MASFLSFFINKKIPSPKTFGALLRGKLTLTRFFVLALCIVVIVLVLLLAKTLHGRLLVTIPAQGGSVSIGEIGTPKTTNPLLANTELEKALSAIVYAGLTKKDSAGEVIRELAEKYDVSPDGKTYTFTLADTTFHSGKAVTAEDVLFTYMKIKEGVAGTTLANYFASIAIETPDTRTVIFTLPESRTDFLEKTTIGILPAYIWSNSTNEEFSSSKYTLKGIGAGAFKVKRVIYKNNIPQSIILKRNTSYVLAKPLLKKIHISFFANQQELWRAVDTKNIDITTDIKPEILNTKHISPEKITSVSTNTTASVYHLPNAGGILSDSSFINALNILIDKNKIISIVENEYGAVTEVTELSEESRSHLKTLGYTISEEGTLLKNGKTVAFSIATTNDPLTTKLVQAFANELRPRGATISVQSFDPGFFYTELGKRSFTTVLTRDTMRPQSAYKEVFSVYKQTTPFITHKRIYNLVPEELTSPKSYYANVHEWYKHTDKVYPMFIKK